MSKDTDQFQQSKNSLETEKDTARMYLDIASTMFVMIDSNEIVQMINQKGCEILECKEKEVIGKNWFDIAIPKNERKQLEEVFTQIMKGNVENFKQYQNFILTKSGNKRLISWNNTLVKDKQGKILGTLSSGEDITEKKAAEDALKKSEKMYRTLFETATQSVITTNSKREITAINSTAKKLFGYTENELLGKSINMLIPPRFKEQHDKHTESYQKDHRPRTMQDREMDLFACNKKGEEFPIEISLNTIEDKEGNQTIIWVNDITKRKKAEKKLIELNTVLEYKVLERTQELKESQRMYKLIARNYPNGVINVFDKDLNYVFVEGKEMFKKGITGKMLIGTSFLDRIQPKLRSEIKEKMLSVFKGKNISYELKIDGRTYMINLVGLHDLEDNITQILMVTQNITKLKRAEEGILDSLKKEQYLNELKSRFVSMASHEFLTPLTSIMNSTTLLSKYIGGSTNEIKQQRNIDRIKSSVIHLTTILNDFLSLDMLEEGKVEFHCSKFNLPHYSHDIINDVKNLLKEGQNIDYEHTGEDLVYLDENMLKNIFYNLLSNAIKYSNENDSISIKTIVKDNKLTLIIEDTGIGIPKEEQKQLFERFFRANNVENIQGTGLGLNIVNKYVKIAGGTITFKSESNKGTMFKVKLPISGDNK